MISQANHIKFKLMDLETYEIYNQDSKEIEFTYDIPQNKLIVWRTVNKTMKLGDLEADVECYDFIDFVLLESNINAFDHKE